MRRLPRPTVTGAQALELCVSSIQDKQLTERLELVSDVIDKAESVYIARGEAAALYRIKGTKTVARRVKTAEMERVYSGTFVKSVKTRHIYDALKKAPVNDICPLCGQRTVFTLDHYLPQAKHPALAVTAMNLVPACFECNKTKLAYVATKASKQTLHPYFDDIDDDRWLFSTVQETSPAAVRFAPRPPAHWDKIKRIRIQTHFETFELGSLYAAHAAVEISNMRFRLIRLAERVGAQGISEHLREIAISCAAAHPNSWQRATYQALADSGWFCSGGFA